MVDQIIRPANLPDRPNPVASEKVPVDNGSTVGGATIETLVNAGRPLANQSEAETGTQATKAMTPLTTKQAIAKQAVTSVVAGENVSISGTANAPVINATAELASGDKGDMVVVTPTNKWRRPRWYSTVSGLLADDGTGEIGMGYAGSGAAVTVSEGDVAEAQGFRYEVAASAATDHHVATAGGVKLYYRPDLLSPNPEALGFKFGGGKPDKDANGIALTRCLELFGVAFLGVGVAYCRDARIPPEGGMIFGVQGRTWLKQDEELQFANLIINLNHLAEDEPEDFSYVVLDGLSFKLDNRQPISSFDDPIQHEHLVALNKASGVVRNCQFIGFQGDGLLIGQSHTIPGLHNQDLVVEDCLFDGVDYRNRNGISVIDGTRITIRANTFRRCTASMQPGAIDIEPNAFADTIIRDIEISENHFENCGGGNGDIGVLLPDVAYDVQPTGFRILNNTGVGGNRALCFVHKGNATLQRDHNAIISGNQFRNYGTPVEYTGVRNLTSLDNSFSDVEARGIIGFTPESNSKCMDVRIIRDSFVRCSQVVGGSALNIFSVSGLDLVDVVLEDCGKADGTDGRGITFDQGSSDHVRIRNMTIRNELERTINGIVKEPSHTFTPSTNSYIGGDLDGLSNFFEAHESDVLWTSYEPSVEGLDSAGSPTYSLRFGRWRRMGRRVFFEAKVNTTAHTGTGLSKVSLPTRAQGNNANAEQAVNAAIGSGAVLGLINPASLTTDGDFGTVWVYASPGVQTYWASGEYQMAA